MPEKGASKASLKKQARQGSRHKKKEKTEGEALIIGKREVTA